MSVSELSEKKSEQLHDIKALRAAFGQCKGQITRIYNYVQQQSQLSIIDKESLQLRRSNIEKVFTQYKDIQLRLAILCDDLQFDNEDETDNNK